MSIGATMKRTLGIGAIFAAALLLAGCFDLELTLKLHGDGSGTLSTRAIVSRQVVDFGHGRLPDSKLLGESGHVRHKTEIRNGQLVQEETTDFESLDQLRGIEGGRIEVTSQGRTFWGAERSRVRWVLRTSKQASDAPPPDPKVVEMMVKGHILIVEMDIPCTVMHAETVKLNFTSVTPFVSSDVISGSTVRWVVPLSALLATPNDQIAFDVECWSFAGIKPGRTPG